ncbi:MAG: sigma 54-interacting transcriptional regulator [Saprospiraceae bacterium]|nr:sigma 54-interacting transcriptional regulator [Saprospiraceae bacterium]
MIDTNIHTLGALKATGYQSLSIKDELRKNLIQKLRNKENIFEGILGFEDTVIPDIQRAILSRHNILLLGLRGQAKTRLARLMLELLDEYIPVIKGTALNDDPFLPLSRQARDLIAEHGDATPIRWLHRTERYVEKLATPDVSVADLIGDVDPIKAATMKLAYSDERVIHFGLIPHAHRSIFVLNELPDLQARIQVALFNILQEGDIQIRGFKLRLPLDIQFVFTANPEDYTNRGSIITPLKDRIESQILTHYPKTIDIARTITQQEANLTEEQRDSVEVSRFAQDLLEQVAFEARASEFVDEKSGVSARLTIAGYENLVSTAERRMLVNGEDTTKVRLMDFWGVVPAITGKVELVYEGEQEGAASVAMKLMNQAIKTQFAKLFPNPNKLNKGEARDPYGTIATWFAAGNTLNLFLDSSEEDHRISLSRVAGLEKFVLERGIIEEDKYFFMELVLHALAEFEVIGKERLQGQLNFSDPLAGMLDDFDLDDEY